jgi:hypothetical protein
MLRILVDDCGRVDETITCALLLNSNQKSLFLFVTKKSTESGVCKPLEIFLSFCNIIRLPSCASENVSS